MKRFVRSSLLAVAALSLAACGSGPKLGGGKEGAAQALFQASDSTSQKGQSEVIKRAFAKKNAMAQDVDVNLDGSIEVSCTHGGSATMSVDTDSTTATDTSVSIVFNIEYDSCNEDGKNELDGDMQMSFLLSTTADSFEFGLKMKGEIDINGEVDDTLVADVTEYIGFNGTSGQVTVKLNGTIETDTEKYTYSNETFTFSETATLPVAVEDEG